MWPLTRKHIPVVMNFYIVVYRISERVRLIGKLSWWKVWLSSYVVISVVRVPSILHDRTRTLNIENNIGYMVRSSY